MRTHAPKPVSPRSDEPPAAREEGGPPAKPKLLFLSHTLPFPPNLGVNIRTYNVLRLLAREFEVTALCFYRKAERSNSTEVEESLTELRKLGTAEAFPIPQEHSPARWVLDHLKSLTTRRAYTHFVYSSTAYEEKIRELLRDQHFDLVHIDSLDLVRYAPLLSGLPTICTHHNVESRLLARRAEATDSRLARWYIGRQASWTANDERTWCPRFDANLAVSSEDATALRDIAPGARVIVVPNGVDTGVFEPGRRAEGGIVFVGGYNWLPNREAMKFFAEEVIPHLRNLGVDPAVTWVGRAPAAVQAEYLREYGFRLTGYVEDIRPYVEAAACYVVPLQTGGGTRLKILDAWAMGKAVVSTSIGCEGLQAVDGTNILIRDDPASFAEAVLHVLQDEAMRRRIGEAARNTAVRVYDWEVVGRILHREYRSHLQDVHAH